jgi:translation initiation factor 1
MADDKTPFNNPFGALGALRGKLPVTPERVKVEAGPRVEAGSLDPAKGAAKKYARAVVRMERAGRGGKEATVIEQLDLSPADREVWLKDLKAALGCGGSIDGESLMLQGDHRKRLSKLLAARGVKKVIVG